MEMPRKAGELKMSEQTRELTRRVNNDGSFSETETAALSSVELGQNTKGEWRVASVKVYHADINMAVREATRAAQSASSQVKTLNTI